MPQGFVFRKRYQGYEARQRAMLRLLKAAIDWDESKHPRDDHGKFAPGGGDAAADSGASRANASSLYQAPTKTEDQIIASKPQEVAAAINSLKVRLANSVPTDASTSRGGFKNPDGTWTDERAAVHREIVNQIFSPEKVAAALPGEGEKPTLTVLGGRGGSGKSWLTGPFGPIDAKKSILLDSDQIKSMLPGYTNDRAALYHEEAGHVLSMADDRALALGVNTIHDATLKSEGTSAERMLNYQAAGYDVDGYYMYLAPEVAASRALDRFASPGKGAPFSGRYVPPSVILGNVNNERNFDKMSASMKHWSVYDNSGKAPRLVSRGGNA